MAVVYNIDVSQIVGKIENATEKGLAMLSSQILRDCNYFCKQDQGGLIASSLMHSRLKEGKLVWQTPYAVRQYYEIRTAYTDKNPNASWRWCDLAKKTFGADWVKQAQAIKRLYE